MLKSLIMMTRLFKCAPWWGKLSVMIMGCLLGLGLYTGVVYAGYALEQRVIDKMDGYLVAVNPDDYYRYGVNVQGGVNPVISLWEETVEAGWKMIHERASHAILFAAEERIECLKHFEGVAHVAIDAVHDDSGGALKLLGELKQLKTIVVGVGKMSDEELALLARLKDRARVSIYIKEITLKQQKRLTALYDEIEVIDDDQSFHSKMLWFEEEMSDVMICFNFDRLYPGPERMQKR